MSDFDDAAAPPKGADMGVVVLMLGLYLIVLAFFILLNAISQESKTRIAIVVQSVQQGFSHEVEGTQQGDEDTPVQAIPYYEMVNSSLQAVLRSHLPLSESTSRSEDGL